MTKEEKIKNLERLISNNKKEIEEYMTSIKIIKNQKEATLEELVIDFTKDVSQYFSKQILNKSYSDEKSNFMHEADALCIDFMKNIPVYISSELEKSLRAFIIMTKRDDYKAIFFNDEQIYPKKNMGY